MKRGFITVLACFLLIVPIMATAAKNPWDQKLPFKSAVIHYQLSGMEKGEETLYIRNYGKEMARYHTGESSMMGMKMKSRTVEITTPDWIYRFDLEEKTGVKTVNPMKVTLEEYNKLSAAEKKEVDKNSQELGTAIMGTDGKREKNAKEILGYSCDMVSFMGGSIYSIHDTSVPLYTDTNIMGISVKSVATKVDEGKVDDKYFQFPDGIEPQHDPRSDQMARSIAQQTIEMLKDPEAAKKSNSPGMDQQRAEAIRQDSQDKQEPPADPGVDEAVEQTMNMLKGLFGN